MSIMIRPPWHLPDRLLTPEAVYHERRSHRRAFLAAMGNSVALAGLAGIAGCQAGSDDEIRKAGSYDSPIPTHPATTTPASGTPAADSQSASVPRDPRFEYGRPETPESQAARYTNFYEFSSTKAVWKYVADFKPLPWQVELEGWCRNPGVLDFDDLLRKFPLQDRAYRHRCVETWAMCVPWRGFPLKDLVAWADPKPECKYVGFTTFDRPDEAPQMSSREYPWPYTEGLTLAEATNELAFIATGIYGHSLPKQHGAPLRLVVPWKYGFKGIKSIVRITFAAQPPATFWNTLRPDEYGFEANVDPDVPHPRWSQRTEWMLGSGDRYDTLKYNGYADFVAKLYC